LLEKPSDYVHLGLPAFIQFGPGHDQILPFLIGKFPLDRFTEGNRFILSGWHGVPHDGDDKAFVVPADGLII